MNCNINYFAVNSVLNRPKVCDYLCLVCCTCCYAHGDCFFFYVRPSSVLTPFGYFALVPAVSPRPDSILDVLPYLSLPSRILLTVSHYYIVFCRFSHSQYIIAFYISYG